MTSSGLYLGKQYIPEELILFVALPFSIKSCAQPLLVARNDTSAWRQITTHDFGAKFEVTPTY